LRLFSSPFFHLSALSFKSGEPNKTAPFFSRISPGSLFFFLSLRAFDLVFYLPPLLDAGARSAENSGFFFSAEKEKPFLRAPRTKEPYLFIFKIRPFPSFVLNRMFFCR